MTKGAPSLLLRSDEGRVEILSKKKREDARDVDQLIWVYCLCPSFPLLIGDGSRTVLHTGSVGESSCGENLGTRRSQPSECMTSGYRTRQGRGSDVKLKPV